jgi:phenylpyruvate tautomerase PptA (4-oxalocrotonate tautomerase family)
MASRAFSFKEAPCRSTGFFTETGSRLTGIDKSSVVVYLRETSHDTVGLSGELVEDKYKKKQK